MLHDTKIYLDIDGVLLANEQHLANHANEFIKYVVTNYPVYWLTTHCKGDETVPVNRIGHLFAPEIAQLLKSIRPTTWNSAKTEAIDFTNPFLWFDDDLFDDERRDLLAHDVLDNWIEVDLYNNPDALGKLLQSFPIPNQQTG